MPYIPPEARSLIDTEMNFVNVDALTKGEMNYLISSLVARWVEARFALNYHGLSEGHSLLQDATAEYYRRVIGPYEDQALARNGDVYGVLGHAGEN